MLSEAGSLLAEGLLADHDSELIVRFRSAGLVNLGRTTTPELGFSSATSSKLCGLTRNPWNPERISGGSSGGAAVAVASGVVPMAHGSDGGGSIRSPACFNGLVGLKPTRGRISEAPDAADPLSGLAVNFAITRTVARAEIDSFLAASGRSEFSRRILIDTTGRPWSIALENTLRHQPIPVQRIGLHNLKASPIDWSEYVSSRGTIVRAPPKTARKHQQQAIDSALAHFAEPDTRGKLLMACGTGKTLAGLRIAETTAGHGGRVLVLVPSLALLSQTLRAWLDDATTEIRAFAVCSDAQTGRPRRRKDDSADMDPLDLVYPATTSAARLAEHAAPVAPDRMTVVFATYQSSAVLEAAQRDHGLPAFDLAIADEAHRTAGALIPGEDLSPFVRIHDNDAIQAHHRLYMTATPKVYAASARKRAGGLATTLCSMEDEKTYGPVLHETRFGEAVDQGLLADYRVIVLTVPEALAANVTIRDFADGQSLTVDEQGRMIGCLRALAKTDKDQFPADDQAPMRRAIAFCNFIESSKQLERRIGDVAAGYAEFTDDHDAPPRAGPPCRRHLQCIRSAEARYSSRFFLA